MRNEFRQSIVTSGAGSERTTETARAAGAAKEAKRKGGYHMRELI
jgi:hypothetical protein